MAAALLAALFAMGVFAPAAVDAGVKGGSEKPMVELTDNRPGQDDVTATLTFTTNAEVDGDTSNDVFVVITALSTTVTQADYAVDHDGPDGDPSTTGDNDLTADPDKITVTQGGRNVGVATISAANTIKIGAHPSDPSKNLMAGRTTTIVIKDLTTVSGAGSYAVEFYQAADTTGDASQTAMVVLSPSVTDASVDLVNNDTDADAKGDREVGATPVTMELTFTVDTAYDSAAGDGTQVVITLPESYDLDTGNDGLDTTIAVSASNGAVATAATTDTGTTEAAETITVTTFDADDTITVTVTNLTNPSVSGKHEVLFKQGNIPAAADEGIQQTETFYITDMEVVDVKEEMLEPDNARSTRATLSFEFGSVVDLSMADSESMITIDLDDGFSGLSAGNVSVMQKVARNTSPVDVGGEVSVSSGNVITIMHDDTVDADNVKKTTSGGRNVGNVMVEISGLTNPSEDGMLEDAIVVTQDGFAPGMADLTITKALEEPRVVLSSYKADTEVKVTIHARTASRIRGGSDIDVTLDGFGIPDGGIDRDDVFIYGTGQNAFFGNPSGVTVSGDKVTLTLPVTKGTDSAGQPVEAIVPAGDYQIVFNQNAGLKTPNFSGTKTIEVDNNDDGTSDHELDVAIASHVSVKPGWAKRGDTVTITGKGINAAGDATAHLYSRKNDRGQYVNRHNRVVDPSDLENLDLIESSVSLVLDRSARDGGTVIIEGVDTSHSSFVADAIDATSTTGAKGYNLIVMVDAAGNNVGHTYFGIQPTVTLDVTEVRRTGRVEVSVSDWYYGAITDAYINGIQVDLPDNTHTPHDDDTAPDDWGRHTVSVGSDNKETFTVIVNRDVRLGEMEVRLVGSTYEKQGSLSSKDAHKQTVDVGFFNLTLTPSTAVTDQVIRIEGVGFGANVCIASIEVGEERITEATTGDRVIVGSNTTNCVLTDSDGDLANSFKVPYNLPPDDYKVVVRDINNRVGEATLTVPKPAITLTPEASQRGSTVTVVGENFPAQDVIGITYGGDTVTVATTDTVGKWRATFKVPVDATIGREYDVVAQSDKKGDGQQTGPTTPPKRANLSAKATHTVPEETLKVWPAGSAEPADDSTEISSIAAGGRLQVKATNLPPHTKVSLFIGDIPVAGKVLGEDAAADSSGTYNDSVLVPQLTIGTHTVELDVDTVGSDVVVVTFVDILDIITRPTTDVFADLSEAGQVLVVWRYRNATQTWASYDFNPEVPAEINDLKLVSTGDIVWVKVTEDVVFQGERLLAGWNLISLE